MKDLNKMLSGLSKSGFMSGMAGGALGGSVTSMLMGKKSRKMGGTALKAGALAAVGGLAWKAYQQYSAGNTSQPVQQHTAPQQNPKFNYVPQTIPQQRFEAIVDDSQPNNGQLLIMRAMITAAYADGHIDAQEQARIFNQVETMDLSVEEKASLFDELRNPVSVESLVAKVPDAETGMEVYAASVLAIDESQPASQIYLDKLSTMLCIPMQLRQAIHQQTQA